MAGANIMAARIAAPKRRQRRGGLKIECRRVITPDASSSKRKAEYLYENIRKASGGNGIGGGKRERRSGVWRVAWKKRRLAGGYNESGEMKWQWRSMGESGSEERKKGIGEIISSRIVKKK